jgi:hypothetical protein
MVGGRDGEGEREGTETACTTVNWPVSTEDWKFVT